MMRFNEHEFNKFLIKNNCLGFYDEAITLKSGRKCNYYVNMRNLTDMRSTKDELCGHLTHFIFEKSLIPDYFYGVPDGATKIALYFNDKYSDLIAKDIPLVMGRGKPKEHGHPKDRYFIGPIKEGDKIIPIEDVTTTAGSLLSEIKKLREVGADVKYAITLVDRLEVNDEGKSSSESLLEEGITLHSLTNSKSLIETGKGILNPSAGIVEKVEEYFRKYEVKEKN